MKINTIILVFFCICTSNRQQFFEDFKQQQEKEFNQFKQSVEIDYDFRQLGRRSISQKEITSLMERNYNVKVHSSELMLMPIWECSIKAKKGDSRRILILDGVTGKGVRK